MTNLTTSALSAAVLLLTFAGTASAQPFVLDDEYAADTDEVESGFMLRVGEDVVPYSVMAAFVMPGETLPLDVLLPTGATHFAAHAEKGTLDAVAGRPGWTWTAPEEPGLVPIVVKDTVTGDTIRMNAFVLTPFDHEDDRIGPYRIGAYKSKPLRNDPVYRRPEGFIRVTRENRTARLSPHFRLQQFLSKQVDRQRTFPQYTLVRVPLLLKLEMIVDQVQDAGYDLETLHVMSGFRTPYYNRLIGNTTSYSRHLYGGAADVFVDADGNGVMDDLTGDGRVTKADARRLANMVESMRDEAWYEPLVGGLGIYGPAPHRGPFVHVDTRGRPARW
ncbi:D-Ala-D-Ala carboxypeptidase family metallohydrolase [Longibacter sp.]|jgi:uncharacterized protein YcbK (DUF882 family)|uniref:D-Ala-D-Ala carboxypeptidase family metallohydrolase n=1 Tax=Longibacter sp. TaxID=2045415 RepID=UPI003EBB9827